MKAGPFAIDQDNDSVIRPMALPDGMKAAVSASPSNKRGKSKPYLLTPASAAPPNTEVRKDANLFMLIDVNAVTKDGKIDPNSKAWRAVHDELRKTVRRLGNGQKLHARFFFARGVDFVGLAPKLEEHFKKFVTDLDMNVVCVDVQVRNDDVGWDDFVRQLK